MLLDVSGIPHDMYINSYNMFLFDLTQDQCSSEGHTSDTLIALSEKTRSISYLEFDNSFRIDITRTVSTDFKRWTPLRYSARWGMWNQSGSLPLRSVTTLYCSNRRRRDNQRRSLHGKRSAVPGSTFPNQVFHCLLLSSVRDRTARAQHTGFHKKQQNRLGLQQESLHRLMSNVFGKYCCLFALNTDRVTP